MGNIRCNCANGRKARNWPFASRVNGTGAPESRKRWPITLGRIGEIAGHMLPSFGLTNGFVPFNAVLVPLEVKNA